MRTDYLQDTSNELKAFNTSVQEQVKVTRSTIDYLKQTRSYIDKEIEKLEAAANAMSKLSAEEDPTPVHDRSSARFNRGSFVKTLTGNADRQPGSEGSGAAAA